MGSLVRLFCCSPPTLLLRLMFFLSSLPQVATLMFIWSGRGIELLPCCRKIFLWRRSLGFRVMRGLRNLI